MNSIIGVIPARFASSRFPGKPLVTISGRPMIQWVYENAKKVSEFSDVYVATDDIRIFNTVKAFGGKCIMTPECSCGSERVYWASKDIGCDIVVNIQGDEPLIKPGMIQDLLLAFKDDNVEMATLKKCISSENEIRDSNVVKVITDINNDAIYFSRFPIPYERSSINNYKWFKHIGLYGYKKSFLKQYIQLHPSGLERMESLEQLRAIENGHKIRVIETEYESIGVDIPDHVALIENYLLQEGK